MDGRKAEAIAELARDTRRACLRFDYSGHGKSGGHFADGTISLWLEQTLHMFAKRAAGRRIVVGSSMGGWLALLLLRKLLNEDRTFAARIAGLVLIAPAVDMTADLMWDAFSREVRTEIAQTGVWMQRSLYGDSYPITAQLIEDGERHLMLDSKLNCRCPVRILQGSVDPDVPASHSMKILDCLQGSDITLTLIKNGDHRLSSSIHLSLIRDTALRLAERVDGISA
jgi:pimeloyl-ACP methyl ester carboxylesterase